MTAELSVTKHSDGSELLPDGTDNLIACTGQP